MIQTVIVMTMNSLMSVLTLERIHAFIQAGADALKQKFRDSEAEWDDKFIPAIDLCLAALNVPGPNGEKPDITAELKKLIDILGEEKNTFLDAGFDVIEQKVVDSQTKLDDAVILPLCRLGRKVLNVPDDDLIG